MILHLTMAFTAPPIRPSKLTPFDAWPTSIFSSPWMEPDKTLHPSYTSSLPVECPKMSHPCIQPSKNNIPGGGTLYVSPTCPTDKRMMSHATMIVILTPAINKFPTIWWEMRSQLLEEIKHLTNAAATPELLHTNHQPAISHQLLTAHQHNT